MRLTRIKRLWLLLLILSIAPPAWAAAEWQVLEKIQLSGSPLDVIVSTDNRWIYLLDDQGQLSIHDANGKLRESLAVGRDIDGIKAGPREDLVFLLSRASHTVQLISVNLIETISTASAPFKGPADAPITVAVFSDFQ